VLPVAVVIAAATGVSPEVESETCGLWWNDTPLSASPAFDFRRPRHQPAPPQTTGVLLRVVELLDVDHEIILLDTNPPMRNVAHRAPPVWYQRA
jgi:hypothetical protein